MEQGLTGFVIDPNFGNNNFFYVSYTTLVAPEVSAVGFLIRLCLLLQFQWRGTVFGEPYTTGPYC